MASTLRRWKGTVAREEGDWAVARFEFLQGRSLAETYDPGNVPWFDAAITEAEVWEAFARPGLELDGLKELTEKLDRTSGLYGLAGDRINEEFTAEWARWFGFFLTPLVPLPALVARILAEVKRLVPETRPGEAPPQSPLGRYIFMWNYFWFSGLARRRTTLLKGIFGGASTPDELMRGASVLVPVAGDFTSTFKLDARRRGNPEVPTTPEQLLGEILSDLEEFHSAEKACMDYLSRVRAAWEAANHQRRMEVEHAMHPRKQRP